MTGNVPDRPILFFDRDVGTALPKALGVLEFPTTVEYHQNHFRHEAGDPEWMPVVGQRGWILIGHDSRHHHRPAELAAIQQYGMGCFYLWGTQATRWEKMRCFLNAYERIIAAVVVTPRPFIFRIARTGGLSPVPIG